MEDLISYTEAAEAQVTILNQSLSMVNSFVLKCAIELGIADQIHAYGGGRPMPLAALARSIPIPLDKDAMLHRIMRLLITNGVFDVQKIQGSELEGYVLTPLSQLLLTKGPNMGAFATASLNFDLLKPWNYMGKWFRSTGSTPFERAFGKPFWDLFEERHELNDLFNESMSCITKLIVKGVIVEYPSVFYGLKSLVDIGGGIGTAVKLIVDAFPEVKCTVFDLPHVIAVLPESRVFDAIEGDMFESIPPANAVFLKSVLHDYSDEDCVKILTNCKEAIPPREAGGKVIIVDMVVNSHGDNPKVSKTHLLFDICLMSVLAGKEREEDEWKKIFIQAGFLEYKFMPMLTAYTVIELYP